MFPLFPPFRLGSILLIILVILHLMASNMEITGKNLNSRIGLLKDFHDHELLKDSHILSTESRYEAICIPVLRISADHILGSLWCLLS